MEQGIYRGTTPSITLNVADVDLSNSSVWPIVIVTVENKQSVHDYTRDSLKIDKTNGGSSVTLTLTQADTLLMSNLHRTMIQIRAKDYEGHAIASDMVSVPIMDVLKDGEL